MLRRYWLAWVFVVCAFAMIGVSFGKLPDPMPVHWNAQGRVDHWMPKSAGALVLPGIALVVTAFMVLIAPKAARQSAPSSLVTVYPTFVAATSAFMFYITLVTVAFAIGIDINVASAGVVGIGILLVIMGNYLGKTTRNGVVGIRNPWTLASDEVWLRTHRVGGWLFVVAGVLTAIAGMMGHGVYVTIAATVAISISLTAYSYHVARQLKKDE